MSPAQKPVAAWGDPKAMVAELRSLLEAAGDAERSTQMATYMKDQFLFFGVPTPKRRAIAKPTLAMGKGASANELMDFADLCWAQPEREFQYVAHDLLRKWAGTLTAKSLPRVEALIRTKSWWDTVDALAAWTVGVIVRTDPSLAKTMDIWIDDADFWIARTAILHQLSYKEHTDADRLFAYADKRAADTEFFIRKALGWALRQYARVDPAAVYAYVDSRGDTLCALTRREALKHRDRS